MGELKLLPVSQTEVADQTAAKDSGATGAGRGVFVAVGLIAFVSFLITAFCGIRWLLIDVPETTEGDIARRREIYQNSSPAELIPVFEEIERFGIAVTVPLNYRTVEVRKEDLATKTLIAGSVFLSSLLLAILVAIFSGSRNPVP